MKKIILYIIVVLANYGVYAQNYSVRLIETDTTNYKKYPFKPANLNYVSYNNVIFGYESDYENYLFNKNYSNLYREITLYNGISFKTPYLPNCLTNKDGTVFYVFGNKTIPEGDTALLCIYNKNGELVYINDEYGWSSFFPSVVSENGYLLTRTNLRDNRTNLIILFSPEGQKVLIYPFQALGVSIAISPEAKKIAAILKNQINYPADYAAIIIDNNNNLLNKFDLDYNRIIQPGIFFINEEYIIINSSQYFIIYSISEKRNILELKDKDLLYTNNYNFEYFEEYNILVILIPFRINNVKIQKLITINLDFGEIIYTEIIKEHFYLKEIEKINNYQFSINLENKTLIYEIYRN